MKTTRVLGARLSAIFYILLFCSAAYAGSAKVEVCHIPPDDPGNFHTIKINENALTAHLAHFDLVGPCNSLCGQLCDDGNACTIDYEGDDCESGCIASTVPTDCSDGNLCTDDVCDPVSGCSNPVAVTCEAPVDNCLVGGNICNPSTGTCEEPTPVVCNDGFECNPDNGNCEAVDPELVCPCFDEALLLSLGTIDPNACGDSGSGVVTVMAFTNNSNLACSGTGCAAGGDPGCGTIVSGVINETAPITADEDTLCRTLIANICP